MAKLLTGTRIYGTGTVDTQLIINGTGQAASTNSGALQIVGGAGIAGSIVVGGNSTFTNRLNLVGGVNATNTTTGDLVVRGGVGIGGDVRVGGTLYATVEGTVIGIITTASSLAAGTTGQVPYQSAPGVTQFFGPGTAGQLLQSNGAAAPSYVNTSSVYVGRSNYSDNLVGGLAGGIPYQQAPNTTTFLSIGLAGTILRSSGTAPEWASTSSLVVGKASSSDNVLLSNDTATSTVQFLTFVSTTTGYTSVKGSAMSGLTYIPVSGLFGVGTSPSYRLHVVETSDVVPAFIERPLGGDVLRLYNSSGLTTNNTQLSFLHKDSTNSPVVVSSIYGFATSLASGAISGGLSFYTSNAGTVSESLRLNQLGNLGLGTNDPAYRLDVSGGARITGITTVTNSTAASSPTTGALQVTGGAGIGGNVISGGQISSTRANNTATNSGQIYLNGATGNRIDFASAGSAAPSLGTRSLGTKIVYNAQLSASTVDFATGMESGALWNSVSSASDSFKWYAANTNIATLSGSGSLTLNGDLAVNGGDLTTNQSTFNLLDATATTINFGRSATAITIGNNASGTTTIRNNLSISTNTNSSAYTNGALVVSGGVGIAGDLRVNGTIYGNVSVSGIISTATNIAGGTAGQVPYQTAPGQTSFFGPGTAGDVLVSNGTSAPTYNNTLALAGTTAATNPTSGALRVAGGAGIQGDLYIGNTLTVGTSGSFVGGATIYKNGSGVSINADGRIIVDFGTILGESIPGLIVKGDATYSTNLSIGVAQNITRNGRPGGLSGAFIDAEGSKPISFGTNDTERMSIEGNGDVIVRNDLQIQGGDLTTNQTTFNLVDTTATTVNFARAATTINLGATSGNTTVRNNLIVSGNLTVQGVTTQVNSTVTNVSDPIFTIGGGANGAAPTADDNKDRGIAFQWHNGANARTGFFGFDDSTGFFTFISSATITNEIVSPAGGTTRGAMDVNLAGGAAGSLPYQSAANVSTFLPIGTNGYILGVSSGLPAWVASSSITVGTASQISMTNDSASTTPQFITFVSTSTGAATVKADAMEGLTFIPSSNFMGIGVGNPLYPLHINVPSGLASIGLSGTASNAQTIKIMQGTTGVSNSGFSIYDVTNGATRLMIGSTGNVGIGTGAQDPTDRLHISNSGGTASLRVGDSASTAAGIIVQRSNSSISALAHYYISTPNSPWQHWGENLTWTSERAGTVNTTHAYKPYYEAYAPVVGYKEFGFINVTSGAFTSSNLISNLTLKNDGTNGINTTTPTDFLTINAKAASATNYGITLQDSTVSAINQTTGIRFRWNTTNAADIKAILTNAGTGASALAFGTSNDGTTISERMRIAQGGNVGIGEQDPGAYGKLTVKISSNTGVGAGGSSAIWLQNANGANGNAAAVFFGDDPANAMGAINFVHSNYVSNHGEITFDTRGAGGYAERLRITTAGRVGIATNSPNVTLDVRGVIQGQSYTVPNTGGSAQWVNLGKLTIPQGGYTARIRTYLHSGYNASTQQDFYVDIFFKTSNSSSVDSNGFAANSWYYSTGFNSHDVTPVWVGNAAGISATDYDLYLNLPSFTNASHYIVELVEGATWLNVGTVGVAAPGVGSATTGTSTLGFNIPIGRVGIGTISPASTLEVNGTARITGITTVTNTTNASSTITGAFQVVGGAGIGGNLFVGGNLNVTGTLSAANVTGTITTATNATNINITNDNATTTDQYVTFVGSSSGQNSLKVSATTGLVWKPNTGSLGLGVSPSLGKLHVSGKGYFTTEIQAASAIMNSATVNGSNTAVFGSNSATVPLLITRNADPAGTDFYINSSGNVSLGSYSLSAKFGVLGPATGNNANDQSMVQRLVNTTANTDALEFSNVRGTAGTDWTTAGFRIQQKVDSTWMGYIQFNGTANGTNNGGISFGTGATTTNANSITERMRINASGNVSIGNIAGSTRLTVQATGANGIALLQDIGTATNSGRLFLQASGGTFALTNVSNTLQFASGATVGSDTGTSRMVLNSSGFLGLGTTQVPLTYLDIRSNNASTQASQVAGFTLRTNENNGMEWHLQHTNGYQGWVAAARVNNNGSAWGQAYLEFITAGSGGGNQVSTMALHGNGNVSIGSTAAPAYKLFVNGSFAATTKSFVIDHPIKAGWKLRYASLEGPENGVYIRGRLKEDNVIKLPDYWRELVDIDSITVDITPVGKYQKLYVQEIKPNYIVIATESDMGVNCFYTVWAERKDVGKLVVEYEG